MADEEVMDTTRMQKLCFMAQQNLDYPKEYSFIPYDYGPFSKHLAEDLQTLRETELIKREFREVEGKERCFYSLTDEGKFQSVRLQDRHDFTEQEDLYEIVVGWQDKNLEKLLSYVFSEWPCYASETVI